MSEKKSKKNTKWIVLGGTLVLVSSMAVLFELGYMSDIMERLGGKNTTGVTAEPEKEPLTSDTQVDVLLKRLDAHHKADTTVDMGLVNSLKSYREIVAARKKNQKTK